MSFSQPPWRSHRPFCHGDVASATWWKMPACSAFLSNSASNSGPPSEMRISGGPMSRSHRRAKALH
eukprot:2021695-Lingulodinium_polyedra.AAC.1